MALCAWLLVGVCGRNSQRPGPSPTLRSLGPSHQRCYKSHVSLRGPPCARGVSGIPHGDVRDMRCQQMVPKLVGVIRPSRKALILIYWSVCMLCKFCMLRVDGLWQLPYIVGIITHPLGLNIKCSYVHTLKSMVLIWCTIWVSSNFYMICVIILHFHVNSFEGKDSKGEVMAHAANMDAIPSSKHIFHQLGILM